MGPAGPFRPPTVAPLDDQTSMSRTASARPAVVVLIGLVATFVAMAGFVARDAALVGQGTPAAARSPGEAAVEGRERSPGGTDGSGSHGGADSDGAFIAGSVQYHDGDPAEGLVVELLTTGPDLRPDQRLRAAVTADDGGYHFDELQADCYVIRFEAPDGASFGEGAGRFEALSCVDPGQRDESVDAELTAGRPGRPFEVTVLHIGDHHSHLLPDLLTVELDGEETEIELGGLARVAAKIAERTAALGDERTLAVHSGGALSGTLLYPVFGGAADAAAMNTICFDVLGFGRQDVALGDEVMHNFADFLADGNCRTEVVTAEEVGFEHGIIAGPTVVRRVEGGVVGFIAVPSAPDGEPMAATTAAGSTLGAETLDELAATVQTSIDELARRGITNIVLISNVGLPNDLALVPRLTGVDAVVGGGSHSLLGDFSTLGLDVDGRYPQQVENLDGQPVCLGHAWQNAMVVGELTLSFEGRGGTVACGGEAHLLLSTVEPDPTTEATIDGYIAALGELSGETLGSVTEELCFTRVPSRTVGLLCSDDVIGDAGRRPTDVQLLIAEAIRARTGAGVGVVDSGVAGHGLAPGPLRVEDAHGLAGSDHDIVHLTMTGTEIAAALEDAVELAIDDESSADSYPYVAGLDWTYDATAPSGARIVELRVHAPGSDATAVDPSDLLTVATLGYLVDGDRDGYPIFAAVVADGRAIRTYVDFSQALFDYIRHDLGGIVTPAEQRSTSDDGADPSDEGAGRRRRR